MNNFSSAVGPEEVYEDYLEDDKKTDEEIELELDEGFLNSSDVKWLRGANRIASQLQVAEEFNKKLDEVMLVDEDIRLTRI